MGIDNKIISGWIRQSRYRAKKADIYSDLKIEDVKQIIIDSNDLCAYCSNVATVLDSPFPLRLNGPNVPANVAACCKVCKSTKNRNDIIWMFLNGHITEKTYLRLIEELCKRRGGELVIELIRVTTGI